MRRLLALTGATITVASAWLFPGVFNGLAFVGWAMMLTTLICLKENHD